MACSFPEVCLLGHNHVAHQYTFVVSLTTHNHLLVLLYLSSASVKLCSQRNYQVAPHCIIVRKWLLWYISTLKLLQRRYNLPFSLLPLIWRRVSPCQVYCWEVLMITFKFLFCFCMKLMHKYTLLASPGLPVFLPAVYKYIISKDNFSPAALTSEDIPDYGVKSLIRELCTFMPTHMTHQLIGCMAFHQCMYGI